MTKFIIRDREAGNRIDVFNTLEEAQKELARFEAIDKAEGTYTPDFYEIIEIYYQIIRTYYETSEEDIYSTTENWVDKTKMEECWEDRTSVYLDKETALQYFEKVKNDKTEWTENIKLQEVKNSLDANGEYIDNITINIKEA